MGFFVTFKKLLYTIEATGWQVSGRSKTDFKTRLKLESYYSNHMSLKMDIKIFFGTFSAVFGHVGAK